MSLPNLDLPSLTVRCFTGGLLCALLSTSLTMADDADEAETDVPSATAERIVGPQKCAECHAQAAKAREGTHHFRTFNELHTRDEAKAIAKKLAIRSIKRESLCTQCHYTIMSVEGKNKPIAGISCESCHGPARDWVRQHQDFGGRDVTRDQETEEHRKARREATDEAGMIRPDQLYRLAENCYQCHTIPNEELVNAGGHKAGSDFELVAWLQGEVRHSFTASGGTENREATVERKRMLYVVGCILDMEYGYRGVAKATQKATYAISMAKRAKRAETQLEAVRKLVNPAADAAAVPELDEIMAIAAKQKLKLNNEAALLAAADEISRLAQKFSTDYDGSTLSVIDGLLPGPDQYRGSPYQP